jgi:KAP-like P-loop domain-containing protein
MAEKLFADDPITNKADDKLNRDLFAEQVAKVCKNVASESSSSVVALVGSWGSGKSSILSLVADSLKADKWSVAEFNPWLLSGVESLMRSFFEEIIETIPTEKDNYNDLRKKLGGYAKAVSPLGKIGSLVGIDASDIINKVGDVIEGDQSLTKKRDELIKELEKLEKPILVILDDLDRLYPQELLMIFKIVRLVGRLPNLHYLLSYDEKTLLDVIAQTDLSNDDTSRARSYLEKMVQVKLDLPRMNATQQLKLVNAAHDEVLERNKITMDDEDTRRVSDAYAECMTDYLNQPRAIKRFFAQVDALYPLVNGEVNFADFTMLTFLRTFEPSVCQLIIDQKQALTGMDVEASFREESLQDRRKRWLGLIKSTGVKNAEGIFDLLSHLFTYVKSARRNASYASDGKDEQLRKRVGNVDYFDRYFVFGVPEEDISDGKIIELVNQLGTNEKEATNALGVLIDKDAVLALRKLQNVQEISGVPPKPLLCLLGDKYLSLKSERGFFSVQPEWAVQYMVKKAMPKVDAHDQKTTIEALTKNLSGLIMLIHAYIRSDEEKVEPLDKELYQVIVEALKKKMDVLGKKKLDSFSRDDYKLLYPYRTMVGDKELTDWLWAGVEAHKWDPVTILTNLVSEATSYGSGAAKKTIGQLDSDTLENYFGLDRLLAFKESDIKAVELNGDSHHGEEPTFENKQNYVLRLLRNRYDIKQQETKQDVKPSAT